MYLPDSCGTFSTWGAADNREELKLTEQGDDNEIVEEQRDTSLKLKPIALLQATQSAGLEEDSPCLLYSVGSAVVSDVG